MHTVRGKYNAGKVVIDSDQRVPESNCRVLVVFLDSDGDKSGLPEDVSSYDDYLKTMHQLTRRELDILRRIRGGLTNKEIAQELGISAGTVRNVTVRIYAKLGVSTRTEAAIRAAELGIQSE